MPNSTADDRRSARSKVFLTATIETGTVSARVRIDDLSAHGARIVGDDLPAIDTPVAFRCNDLSVSGFIAWVAPPLAGIGFGEPVEPSDALRNIPRPRPGNQPSFRRPGFRSRQLTPAEQRLAAQWNGNQTSRPGE
jgi:hypothetical protein